MSSARPQPRRSKINEELRTQALALSKMAPQELALYLAQLDDTVDNVNALRREVLKRLRFSAPTYAETYAVLNDTDPLF